ncbi:hypothetical protein XELAEV_18012001mg [Xenopus laevis]|uniref:Uncharacterized protein n=1 Tax=Xenopus laevis TaxID=8355 RepID=A0A974DPI7_XENLA|nr:hypothetical protein XELAEV_18012001mg [Xenopus laevis]
MASTWKEFVEFSMPSSPPTAYVSANLGNASSVGLTLSPYGRSQPISIVCGYLSGSEGLSITYQKHTPLAVRVWTVILFPDYYCSPPPQVSHHGWSAYSFLCKNLSGLAMSTIAPCQQRIVPK